MKSTKELQGTLPIKVKYLNNEKKEGLDLNSRFSCPFKSTTVPFSQIVHVTQLGVAFQIRLLIYQPYSPLRQAYTSITLLAII